MSAPNRISDFRLHGSTGLSVPRERWADWVLEHQNKPGFSHEDGYGLGRITHVTWRVDDRLMSVPIEGWNYCHQLPDSSGFICFESDSTPENCTLLDAYGKERMRLTVPWELTLSSSAQQPVPKSGPFMIPWQMTGASSPDPDVYEITFGDISEPYINPADGKKGQFGVTGWVGDKYYFELDYHTGQFLWCKRIMD